MLNELIVNTLLPLSHSAWSTSWHVELTGELVAFALMICFVGLFNLEARLPKINHPTKQTRQSYRTNISLFVFNSVLMSVCSVSTLFIIAERYSSYGLLNSVSSPALKAILAFLAIDLLLYVWHQACHRVDVLWMFHRVHHNDPHLNVSTAFRLHFVEVLVTNLLKALLIVILGIDKVLVLAIEALITLCIMFHHTNTSFKYEQILGRFMIVPFLHRVHHSTERSEHDRNYGAAFSIWDRLFGTLSEIEPKSIGIKGNSPMDLFNLIKFGFSIETPTRTQSANLNVMIAEAAFYKAEKRNFYPGYEMRDWLEAKKDILNAVYGNNHRRIHFGWEAVVNYCKVMLSNFNQAFGQQSQKDFKQNNLQWR
jgi:sterol desaturase/sphingolipid hydroxylase (fatty acid hydroxylase superfamily)